MLARLFIIVLLAISVSSVRGWTPIDEAPPPIQVLDAEPGASSDGEVMVARESSSARPSCSRVATALQATESARTSPDLDRVFRPPRLSGS